MASSELNAAFERYAVGADILGLNELFSEVVSYGTSVARLRGLTWDGAEEVAQETAISVLHRLNTFDRSRSSFKTWVHRISLDRIEDHFRKSARSSTALPPPPINEAPPTPPRIDPVIMAGLDAVAGTARELMDLVLHLGDVASAADALGMSTRAAQQRLRKVAARYFAGAESIGPGLNG